MEFADDGGESVWGSKEEAIASYVDSHRKMRRRAGRAIRGRFIGQPYPRMVRGRENVSVEQVLTLCVEKRNGSLDLSRGASDPWAGNATKCELVTAASCTTVNTLANLPHWF